MTDALERASWPIERVHEAMAALASRAGLAQDPLPHGIVVPSRARLVGRAVDRWLERVADVLRIDAESVDARYPETARMLASVAPAIVSIDEHEHRWLAVIRREGDRLRVLLPDDETRTFHIEEVRARVAGEFDALGDQLVDGLLESANVTARSGSRARRALRDRLVAHAHVRRAFMIRAHPSAPLRTLVRDARLVAPLVSLLLAHVLGSIALVLAWVALGSGVLGGRVDPGWLTAAALLALTRVPLRAAAATAQGRFAIRCARLLKQRLLWGALRIDRDAIRREGAGQLLARVLESEAVESLALDGGVASALALVELAVAAVVLALGGAYPLLAAMGVVIVVGAVAIGRFVRRRRAWIDARIGLTHDLVEHMVGHRTRLAQEPSDRWHEEEDVALGAAMSLARSSDAAELPLRVLSRAYLVLAIAALAHPFIVGASQTSLAVAVFGALLAQRALAALGSGVEQLARAAIGADRLAVLLRAGETRGAPGDPSLAIAPENVDGADVATLEVRGATLRYEGRLEPALQHATLRIAANDRILCVGPSGGGKSTLAQLLAAVRRPSAGLVLCHGLDTKTLGEDEWRRRVALVPQFHDNHVFAGTLGFNLLLGDRWPATGADLARAEEVCRALGLGSLIDRMPAGLMQQVGDSGWQLSHGERSRVFLARALLAQSARVLVLDESFGALDPETLEHCVHATLERAPAVMVIAHP
ncbi:ABC transporter ATP-binding protein/permease [Sandaracinus amylolyticus]|uniref:Transport ATP-binding protein CydC n=1 Tax=Sandaracinus amylolyticus TaxID=927083 RepID=A0A0F6W0S2_9BACT|nr:ABC transporter ATP-binding protein/permease [Sandaracinus amylolyticus]AKF04315.1 Transport ATP-binding protein CydC [Sandaracinus amylolyticus]